MMDKRKPDTLIAAIIALAFILTFMFGMSVSLDHIESKQHTEKAGCEYVEQAPCKIIYIKDE